MSRTAGIRNDVSTEGPVGAVARNGSTSRRMRLSNALEVFGLFAFLLGIVAFFAVLSPRFLTAGNVRVILSTSAVLGIVAVGQTLVIISGGFDLSVGGVIPLAGVLYAMSTNNGIPVTLALLLVLGVGVAIGVVNGVLVTRGGINPLIATLGTLSITGGLAFALTDGVPVSFDNIDAGVLAETRLLSTPNHVWLVTGLAIAAVLLLRYTVLGRMIYSIGGNGEASWLAGMRVHLVRTFVYASCSALAALAGTVLASQLLSGSGSLGSDAALTSIAAVILGGGSLAGGVGTIWGTAVGVLILGAMANGMAITHVSSFYQTIATGVILLVAVGLTRIREVVTSRS